MSGIKITLDPQFSVNSRRDRKESHTKKKFSQTASLDRIDNSKGYIEGNVQWLHKKVNLMKSTSDQDEFVEMCALVGKEKAARPRVSVVARTHVEGIHRWKACPIEEVSYLRDYHRHVFHIAAKAYVAHSDRDIEFIQLSHDIKEYLSAKYYSDQHRCLFFDDASCEMLAEELLNQFNLYECEVNEDNEGGAIVRKI